MQAGVQEFFSDSVTSNGNDRFTSLLIQKDLLEVETFRVGVPRWECKPWRPPDRKKENYIQQVHSMQQLTVQSSTSRSHRNESHATKSTWCWGQIKPTLPWGGADMVILLILMDMRISMHHCTLQPGSLLDLTSTEWHCAAFFLP